MLYGCREMDITPKITITIFEMHCREFYDLLTKERTKRTHENIGRDGVKIDGLKDEVKEWKEEKEMFPINTPQLPFQTSPSPLPMRPKVPHSP